MNLQDKIAASTNIISAVANVSMASTAIYVAFKARNFFKSKTQEIIFDESSKLIQALDLIHKKENIFNIFFPFKLAENDLNLWADNDDFKERVDGFLSFSIQLSDDIKTTYNEIKKRASHIHLNGGVLNKKTTDILNELLSLLFSAQTQIGDYNFLTSTLFDIKSEKTHISQFIFYDFSGKPFKERILLIDPHLARSIKNTSDLFSRIFQKIDELKSIYSKGKFTR
ncbi:hypothetical protein [Klebsiella variicola]|uniref:hypothetical protein n=2 Tax=Klebsiella pneumoniae complex TaxID=3390273 RepID=UPI002FFA30EA